MAAGSLALSHDVKPVKTAFCNQWLNVNQEQIKQRTLVRLERSQGVNEQNRSFSLLLAKLCKL